MLQKFLSLFNTQKRFCKYAQKQISHSSWAKYWPYKPTFIKNKIYNYIHYDKSHQTETEMLKYIVKFEIL